MLSLFASADDYCLLKFKLVAAAYNLELNIVTGKTEDELSSLDSSAKGYLLQIGNTYLSQQLAILRYLSQAGSVSSADDLERAQIDQWLEFSVQELGNIIRSLICNNFISKLLIEMTFD